MPKSKSKRSRYQPPPKAKPPPSPRWVPIVFFTLLVGGFLVILARYMLFTQFPALDKNWLLFVGLVAIGVAFGVATRWR